MRVSRPTPCICVQILHARRICTVKHKIYIALSLRRYKILQILQMDFIGGAGEETVSLEKKMRDIEYVLLRNFSTIALGREMYDSLQFFVDRLGT